MSPSLETLAAQALQLPAAERALLLEKLISSFDADPDLEALWDEEADRREADLASGRAIAVPGPEAVARLRARLDR